MKSPVYHDGMMSILKYPGSKNTIADRIISLFPEGYRGMTYIEPFFGSGAVFFRKAPSAVETINDINQDVYNLFLQLRENGGELAGLIGHTPWSRREYEESYCRDKSDLENARRFLVRCWFSIASTNQGSPGWSCNITTEAGNISRWGSLPEALKEASLRLRPKAGNVVQIENRDAFDLMERYSHENVLMYLDPPYVLSARKHKKQYAHEMPDGGHIRLCQLANESRAKIILSGYENGIYEEHLKNFHKEAAYSYDQKGNRRLEVLWMNYRVEKGLFDEERP